MSTIFEGVDILIDQHLDVLRVGTPPHHRHRACLKRLNGKPESFEVSNLLKGIASILKANWEKNGRRHGSKQNWRWKKQLYIRDANQSREKQFEKAIVAKCGQEWVNQVPTASGLTSSIAGKHCNIDLIHRLPDETCEFIELKYDSDTPLFAAFEILKYGLLYVFTRQHLNDLTVSLETDLFALNQVHLRVIAPAIYYSDCRLDWLALEINRGLAGALSKEDFGMDLKFESICWPRDADVCAAITSRTNVSSAYL
jgi:hypothetical protein